MKEAILYKKLDDKRVSCFLCSHHCLIDSGHRGFCGVRENQDGTLMTLVYGRLIAQHVDPIEKKPLFHFLPGSKSYSIATAGCNFSCLFCQNADISQAPRDRHVIFGDLATPRSVVENAKRTGCRSIAYTYTEPTIFMEFALEASQLAHENGIRNVFVTNGYMTERALKTISPYLDAANVDLKSFDDSFYREQCGAQLAPVLRTLGRMKEMGIWVEVTTLIIPGLNDDPEKLKALAAFLVSLGSHIPWHVSRFYPQYQLTQLPPTPVKTLHMARTIGLEAGLKYVYTGNIPGNEGESTYCHRCSEALINRHGFSMEKVGIDKGKCRQCGAPAAGVQM